jgi:tetratricopeptide (TPR) repeat protein
LSTTRAATTPLPSATTHHYLALLAGRRHDLAAAGAHFEQAIVFYERVGDQVNREVVRSNLASVSIQARQFAAALEPASQALRFFAAMGNSVRVAQNASNLAEAHAELGNLEDAERNVQIVLGQEEPQSHPYALYTLGTVYRRRGNWRAAARYYEQSRRIAEANDDAYLLAFACRALGEVIRGEGQAERAREHFGQALALFTRLNIPDEVRETERLAAQGDA